MTISSKTVKWIAAIAVLVALVGVLFLGMSIGREQALVEKDAEFTKVLEGLREDHKEVVVARNKQVQSLQEALAGKDAEIGLQADLILKLKDKPAEVKYLTRVETVLVPTEPQVITVPVAETPQKHLFTLNVPDGVLTVARMERVGDQLELQTYEQKWVLNAALGETSSSFLLRGSTSFEPGVQHEVPVEVQVTHIDEDAPKVVAPKLALGVTTGVGLPFAGSDLQVGVGGSLTLPWLHPRPNLDVLVPRVTVGSAYSVVAQENQFVFRAGLDAASFNIGEPAPLIEDLWLGVGPSVGTNMSWAVDLSLTTRL